MPRFFVPPFAGDTAVLTGEDAHHLAKVLRARVGEAVDLCDGEGTDYRCVVHSFSPQSVTLQVVERTPSRGELPRQVTLYQALCKGDKMEQILQKAVELGVGRMVPIITARCVSLPDRRSLEKKRERWQKIALAAAQQSGRGKIPAVEFENNYVEMLNRAIQEEAKLFMYETGDDRVPMKTAIEAAGAFKTASVVTGPEGGFTEAEAKMAKVCGMTLCSMGERILRCETAPVIAVGAIMYAAGEL